MADQIITNEIPTTATPWFCAVRLVETLIGAGWTLVENSDGTTVSTVTNYWTAANFGTLGADSWTIIQANSGQQICFRRGSASSTTDGWIIWSKGGGFLTGGTASAPANIPADTVGASSHYIRGTFTPGTPGSFTTDASWFGSTTAPERLNIGARDASGVGDESWWILHKGTGTAWTASAHGSHGALAFEALEQPAGLGITDTAPYAWWCPRTHTSNWAEGFDDGNILFDADGGGTEGRWRRWFPGDPARGSITCIAGANHVDGENFVLDDGVNAAVTFEFDSDASVVESTTLRAITFTGAETSQQMRDLIITAINAAPTLNITANTQDAAIVGLVNDLYTTGATGNKTITETVADLSFVVSGMANGQDEDFTQYGSGGIYQSTPTGANAGENPIWSTGESRVKHQVNAPLMLHRVRLLKTQADGQIDGWGGYTKNILFSPNDANFVSEQTAGNGAWAKFGNFITVWWSGDPNDPPL